jgi:hypothetical protein
MQPDLGTQWWSGLEYADLALKKGVVNKLRKQTILKRE